MSPIGPQHWSVPTPDPAPSATPASRAPVVSPRERRILIALAVLYAVVLIPIGINKGADLEVHLELVRRLLGHEPLYTSRAPNFGQWWPPFTLVLLVPFAWLAAVSLSLAKACFTLLNVAAFAFAVCRSHARYSRAALVAIAAVAMPLQTNFEYLNLNALLLALLVLAGDELAAGRDARAGVALGLATALKAFPGLLFAYLAWRRQWRALAVGVGTALGLTLVAALVAAPDDMPGTLARWWSMGLAAIPEMHGRSQSLPALLFRFGVPLPWQAILELGALGGALWALGTQGGDPRADLAIMMVVAVFLSPVAHTHYYLLVYPAWCVLLTRPPAIANRVAWYALTSVAGVATSGLLTVGAYERRRALLGAGIYAWGALLFLALL
ncbi:MAG TPA: glycosyltransferase family 87 protein, partial [Gemmatimonadales bacterium]|nr:glycosyltransferase family 87 protein [Gemmatimonadales bacterium]